MVIAVADVLWTAEPSELEPGTFDEDLNVVCSKGKLAIMKIKPAGAGLMTFGDFINGWRVQPGDKLVKVEE